MKTVLCEICGREMVVEDMYYVGDKVYHIPAYGTFCEECGEKLLKEWYLATLDEKLLEVIK